MTTTTTTSGTVQRAHALVRAAAPHRARGWPLSLDLLRNALDLFAGSGTALDGMTLATVNERPSGVQFGFTRRDGKTDTVADVSEACAYLLGALERAARPDDVARADNDIRIIRSGTKWAVMVGGRSVWITRLQQYAETYRYALRIAA